MDQGFSLVKTRTNGIVKLEEKRTCSHSPKAAARLKQTLLVLRSDALGPIFLVWFAGAQLPGVGC